MGSPMLKPDARLWFSCFVRHRKSRLRGSPAVSHLGIAGLIIPSSSFFHAQTNVSVDITEEFSPNVRMILKMLLNSDGSIT